tara:strand:- start:1756 stop:2406 length:651 start_codon:yes stop_codon:yes gene_type:complete
MINGIKPKVKPQSCWDKRDQRFKGSKFEPNETVLVDGIYKNGKLRNILKNTISGKGILGKEMRGEYSYHIKPYMEVIDYRELGDGRNMVLLGGGLKRNLIRDYSSDYDHKYTSTPHEYFPSVLIQTDPEDYDRVDLGLKEVWKYYRGGVWIDENDVSKLGSIKDLEHRLQLTENKKLKLKSDLERFKIKIEQCEKDLILTEESIKKQELVIKNKYK